MVFVKEKRCVVGSLINQEREIDALEEEVRNKKDKDAGEDEVVAQKGEGHSGQRVEEEREFGGKEVSHQ